MSRVTRQIYLDFRLGIHDLELVTLAQLRAEVEVHLVGAHAHLGTFSINLFECDYYYYYYYFFFLMLLPHRVDL